MGRATDQGRQGVRLRLERRRGPRDIAARSTEPGKNSPYRDRSIEENLDLFERMRAGEFPDGSRTLRAKIDMASPNLNMRDPVMYRILHATHHRSGDRWCIYPTYDFTHGQSDSIERITHSICTLEFENHRPLYDWYIRELGIFAPQQIEFARLNLTYTVMSKRRLLELVKDGFVSGWDDPRMPTICGLRRRGYTPESIRDFCATIGVSKVDSVVDIALLEHCLRNDLNKRAPRVMGVLRPLRVVIDNYPEGQVEQMEAVNNPEDAGMGTRQVPFSRELWIEQDDFREVAPKKYHRLAPGQEVRLRYAYLVRCVRRGERSADGRSGRGALHLRSGHPRRQHARRPQGQGDDPLGFGGPSGCGRSAALRPPVHQARPRRRAQGPGLQSQFEPEFAGSVSTCYVEPSLKAAAPGSRYQFERLGYFCVDSRDSTPEKLVFNRTVTLKDSWAKIEKSQVESSQP